MLRALCSVNTVTTLFYSSGIPEWEEKTFLSQVSVTFRFLEVKSRFLICSSLKKFSIEICSFYAQHHRINSFTQTFQTFLYHQMGFLIQSGYFYRFEFHYGGPCHIITMDTLLIKLIQAENN